MTILFLLQITIDNVFGRIFQKQLLVELEMVRLLTRPSIRGTELAGRNRVVNQDLGNGFRNAGRIPVIPAGDGCSVW